MSDNDMSRAVELAIRFGGHGADVDVPIGNPGGWGWADAALAAQLPADCDGNPYEYVAYDEIRDDWPAACKAVEAAEPGADDRLRELLSQYREAIDPA